MTYTNNKLYENDQSNCTKYEEYDVGEKKESPCSGIDNLRMSEGNLRVLPNHGRVDVV
jgi:hypothetical protein